MLQQRSNDIFSGILHAIGAGLAIAALTLLAVFAEGGKAVTASVIFGSGLVLLYLASASYHLLPHHLLRAKGVLQKLDHSMIYVLIAATYTPVCLLGLGGAWGWSIFGVSWGLAILGILSKTLPSWQPPHWLGTLHYLVMGWLIIIAWPALHTLSAPALWWLTLGGVIYTSGVTFYALDRKVKIPAFGLHEVFHLFVMAGSFCHFWLVLRYW
jgi:hemolysin III